MLEPLVTLIHADLNAYSVMQRERPSTMQYMNYGAYSCVVHNSEYVHHDLFLLHLSVSFCSFAQLIQHQY